MKSAILTVLVAILLRVVMLIVLYSLPNGAYNPLHITDKWDNLSRNIIELHKFSWVEDGSTPTITRTPVYPLFLAGLIAATGDNLFLMKLLYMVLDGILVLMIMRLTKAVFGDVTASRWAGLFYCLFLYPAWHASKLSPDVFFSFLLLGAMMLYLRYMHNPAELQPPWRGIFVTGLMCGLVVLTKKVGMLLIPIWLLLTLARKRFALRTIVIVAVMAIAAALVLTPWLYRNYRVAGRPAPLQTLTWTIYWYGEYVDANLHRLSDPAFRDDVNNYVSDLAGNSINKMPYALTVKEDMRRDARLRSLALHHMREDPGHLLAKSARNIVRFWYLTETGRMTKYTGVIGAILFTLILLGLAYAARTGHLNDRAVLVLLTILYFNLIYAPFFSIMRYMIPVAPYIAVFAGYGLSRVSRGTGLILQSSLSGARMRRAAPPRKRFARGDSACGNRS
jgi:hypothetical protein